MTPALYALRLAGRELRGGLRGFRIFLACLVLGAGALAGLGSLSEAVLAGIRADARLLIGGDVNVRLAYRAAGEGERRFLADSGTLSEVAKLRAMARAIEGGRRSLIELQAVDAAYPLYGEVGLNPAMPLAAALGERAGTFGVVVEPAVASRLGLAIGDRFRIGDAVVQLRATIEAQPDTMLGGLAFGPRVLISQPTLAATGLIRPGALVNHEYRLRLPDPEGAAAWTRQARAAFPDAGWQISTAGEAAPSLQRLIERVGFFLDLVALTALLVGGIGIGNAVSGYVESKTATIGTLKCLGASTGLVFAAYLAQILALAALGIALGLVLGGLLPALVAPLLHGLLPVDLRLGVYPAPLAAAALCALLTVLVFSLWPLAAIARIPPASLFRDRVAPAPRRVLGLAAAGSAAAAIGLAALVVGMAPDARTALWYVAAVPAALLVCRLGAAGLAAGARHLPRPSRPMLRLALANLHRPGAPAGRGVLSLGIGLAVLAAVALVQGNLAAEIDTRLADRAPADFFIDIQSEQLAGFAEIVRATPGASFVEMPMLRGRITRLNGTPVEQAKVMPEAQWAVRSDRGLTYAAEPPAGSRIVAGSWWPADYHGPPLVSFDTELAQGMGLRVGDTLTVNLLGREITAQIANLRQIDWAKLGINFAIVFAPGTLEMAPQTRLAAVYLPAGPDEDRLVQQVTDRFPNITAIPVREGLVVVSRTVAAIGRALSLVALVTLAVGLLVLAGAIAAGQRRRVYDAVVLKVLGASRGAIARALLIELAAIGVAAAVLGGALGTAAAYAIVTWPMRGHWVFLPAPLAAEMALALVLTLIVGAAGTWRALGARPAAYLRQE